MCTIFDRVFAGIHAARVGFTVVDIAGLGGGHAGSDVADDFARLADHLGYRCSIGVS